MTLSRRVLYFHRVLQVSGERFYADVAKDILQYVSRDLSDEVNLSHGCLGQHVCVRSACVGARVPLKGADGPQVTTCHPKEEVLVLGINKGELP